MELIKKYFNFGDEDKSLIVKLVGLHLVIIALANYVGSEFSGTRVDALVDRSDIH